MPEKSSGADMPVPDTAGLGTAAGPDKTPKKQKSAKKTPSPSKTKTSLKSAAKKSRAKKPAAKPGDRGKSGAKQGAAKGAGGTRAKAKSTAAARRKAAMAEMIGAKQESRKTAEEEQKRAAAANKKSLASPFSLTDLPDFSAALSPDSYQWTNDLMEVVRSSQQMAQNLVSHHHAADQPLQQTGIIDPLNVSAAFTDLLLHLATEPERIVEAQYSLWTRHMELWQNMARRQMGEHLEPVAKPAPSDKRFRDEDWDKIEIFDFIKQSYLITAEWLNELVGSVSGMDEHAKKKVMFHTGQLIDAFSPSNFPLTNPEVLRQSMEDRGANLVRGLNHLLKDLERGRGRLQISQTDMEHFEIGRNVATAPGKVIYETELFQLLQFDPTTETVKERPMLIFPPWINKYYILDLQPENSFIRWLVNKGYTVFVVSWVNPDEKLAERSFVDYMRGGVFEALDVVEKATGADKINAIGYCIGGTLLGTALAYMAAHGDDRIASATFFATQLDFSEAGDLKVFVDDEQLHHLERKMNTTGYLAGADMAQTFNMLRANDLIWSYVVNNYLLGKEPFRFDLLYWNGDATRMPKKLHLFYLREFYQHNRLSKGEMVIDDTRLDLSKVKIPIYMQASREDHIAPALSVFKSHNLFGGKDVTFMIAGSGHIAGVINPPKANKYRHWLNPQRNCKTLEEWLDGAREYPGSWWPHWEAWLRERSGGDIPARVPGDGPFPVIEDAPGSYVKVKS